MRRIVLLALALLILPAVALVWSGGGGEPPADFRFINRGEIKTLDPNRMSWAQDIRIGGALWEGLYSLDPVTLRPVPGMADRVEVSGDDLIWKFHIRENTGWSDGSPVVADDFIFAWRRMLEQPGDYTYLFHYIEGAKEFADNFAENQPADFSKVGISSDDPHSLTVRLEHRVAYFPDLCAFAPFYPLHQKSMAQFLETDPKTGRQSYRQEFTKPPHLQTNGPYRLASWEYKQRMRLVANEHYWDRANVKCKIIDQISADGYAAFNIYDTGGVDWLAEVIPDIGAELRIKGRSDLRRWTGFGTYFYSLNCQAKLPDGSDNPLADVRVRQALAMSIDKKPIVENVTRMGEPIATTYIPRGIFPDYQSPAGLAYDVAKAQALLTEAGYPGGAGFPKLSILFNNESHHGDVAQIIRRQWLENLGIDVDLEGVEVKIFGNRLRSQKYSIARASWIGDYPDPSTFTDKYLTVSDNNDAKWLNPRYDDLLAKAALEADPTKRLALFTEAETLLLDEAPIIPIYSYGNADLFRSNVKGLPQDPRNMINFKSIEVVR